MESEKATERYLADRVKKLGGITYKFTSPMHSGVPDRICILPGNIIFFVEVKSEGKKPTELQQHTHKLMRDRGAHVHVVDTKVAVNEILNMYRRSTHDNG